MDKAERIAFAAATMLVLSCGCERGGAARVVAPQNGVRFQLAPISDEYAQGVSAGLSMCGLFEANTTSNLHDECWEFTATYRK